MKVDTAKIFKTPKDGFEASTLMNESQQQVLSACHIMISALENYEPENKNFHEMKMREFIMQFIKN